MVPDLRATHAREKFLRSVRASAVEPVGFLMVDPLHFEAALQVHSASVLVR
jgi:hypothetical protein